MRAANILTAFAVAAWLILSIVGRGLVYDFYKRGPAVFPRPGQFDFYVLLPLSVTLFLIGAAWVVNAFGRWPAILVTLSSAAILLVYPYLVFYVGGGV